MWWGNPPILPLAPPVVTNGTLGYNRAGVHSHKRLEVEPAYNVKELTLKN
jgi:hypothetical protein